MRFSFAMMMIQTDPSQTPSTILTPAPQTSYQDHASMLHHMSDALFQSLDRCLQQLAPCLSTVVSRWQP